MGVVIAIDGPAGAGKSTVAKKIADVLSYFYIDSGALFRAITFKVIESGQDMSDISGIIDIARNSKIDFLDNKVFLDDVDVSNRIRSNIVNANVSYIAKISEVRDVIADIQRNIALKKNIVVEGRDIGTTIFPNAEIKFFLIASIEERAGRRLIELNSSGSKYSLEEVIEQISKRDIIDSNREVSPLKKAEDAIIIDTDNKSIEKVIDEMLLNIKNRLN